MKHSIKLFVLAVISMVAGTVSYAQVTTASIAGRISDNEGPVAGAAVMAVYQPTGATYYAVTDVNGAYRINGITPGGPYTVSVDMLGYRKVENQGVYAPLGEAIVINSTLEVEDLTLDAAVFVADATESGMNIRRSGAGTAVSQKTMSSLPTVNRSMNDVMKLTPQASTTSNGLAVGGGNYRSSYVTVDGAAFNNAFGIGSNLPAGGSPISLDAVEQMSVNITPFDVRHSGFTGGAINAVTKSGTNDYHASVYDYFTNQELQGHSVDDATLSISKFLNHTVGVSVGGPIIKNKLFFFVNGEYTWDNVPGSSKVVSSGTGRTGANFNPKDGTVLRPTETFMNEVAKYLNDTYGYNPGRYQGYSLKTPDYKVMARLDWIINEANKLNVRLSHTHTYGSNNPSNSVNPIVPNPYDRNNYGRTSNYAQFFESNRYYQEQNFTSLAAELNSRLSNSLSNTFRFTWSHQDEPRSFEGGNFPTVDIMEPYTDASGNTVNAVLTSFGPDPFTYGNLRDVQTYVVTDELVWNKGIHNMTFGAQYEWNNTKNGYMQGGLGYYVYDSWEDFKAGGKPAAFAITHSNRDDLAQVFPSFKYIQYSVYAQDEITFSEYFKLTAGLRLELPVYPKIAGNENKEFLQLAQGNNSLSGHSTADMPKNRINFSPRIGFNWDALKDRSLIVRGGAGIYTGRIPFVWIVSVAGNSNCLQAQYILPRNSQAKYPNFHADVKDILNDIYGGQFKAQDLAAPTGATIIDKNLKMPTTVKASLAVDARLPWGIKATIEGIYNKDIETVAALRLGYTKTEGGLQLPGEPKARNSWKSEDIMNSQNSAVAPYYLTNKTLDGKKLPKGHYYSVTAQLSKDFNWGLSLMAAYTRSGSKSIQEGYGDQVSSLFSGGNYGVNGSNEPELGNSAFVSPNRFIANVSYKINEGKNATTIGLFYEGYNHCYVGNYSYTRYSYVLGKLTGEGGSNNLMYIPTDAQLEQMEFTSADNKAAFKAFLASDSYTKNHRGQYSTRGAKTAPWQGRFNLKVAHDFNFSIAGRNNTLQLGVDILNVANLLNSSWGLTKQVSTENILNYKSGKYTFTEPTVTKYKSTFCTWQMLLSAKLSF